MKTMELRLLLMDSIVAVLGAILLTKRGFSDALAGLLAIGLVVLGVGLIWKQLASIHLSFRSMHWSNIPTNA
jgi:hypothetical protein